jgi:serine/threonine protein kinase
MANERVIVLSDVARGLAYLHSEVRVIHRDVKSANVLLDRGCQGRIGDFGIARSLNDNHSGITSTHMHTEHVMGTQVYMAPEYIHGELSTKVDAFAFGLVVLETLTGYAVCSPAPGHRNLLSMFDQELDTAIKLLAHLDRRACWDQHKGDAALRRCRRWRQSGPWGLWWRLKQLRKSAASASRQRRWVSCWR